MKEQKENIFVSFVKKSVGLPTGKSSCCGAAPVVETGSSTCCAHAPQAGSNSCCGAQAEAPAPEKGQPAGQGQSGCCGENAAVPTGIGCC